MGDLYPVMKIENGLFQKSSKVYENTCQLFFFTPTEYIFHFSKQAGSHTIEYEIASDLGPNCLLSYLGN